MNKQNKTPFEMAKEYANGDKIKCESWENGFLAGVKFEIERKTKVIIDKKPLSDNEINNLFQPKWPCDIDESEIIDFGRAIEKAHGIK